MHPLTQLKYFQRGFTLIEMLVVMVIISLLITVIMQGFGYSLGLYQRVLKSQRNAYTEVLAYNWLRSTLATQVAPRPKTKGLEGNVSALSTYTYQPLIEQSGLKTRIDWQLILDGDYLNLEYHEGSTIFPVYRWPASSGQFEYLDAAGEWRTTWPSEKSEMPALPAAVRLLVVTGKETHNYVITLDVRKNAELSMDEMLYGR